MKNLRWLKGKKSLILEFTIVICSVIMVNISPLFSDNSGAAFLKIDPSARSYALGRSQVVNSMGAEAINANPAQLMLMDRKFEMFSAFSSLTEGTNYGYLGLAINRSLNKQKTIDAIGLSVAYLDAGNIDGRDDQGNLTSSFGSRDQVISLSMSGSVNDRVRLGVTGKVINSKLAGYDSGNVFAGDLGMNYTSKIFDHAMRMGLSVNNIGQEIKYISEGDKLPASVNLGITNDEGAFHIVLGASQLIYDNVTEMTAGMELNLSVVSLRAGYLGTAGGSSNLAGNNSDGITKVMQSLTTGVGIKLGTLRIDYAIGQQSEELGLNHRMSLSYKFGGSKEDRNTAIDSRIPTRIESLQKRKLDSKSGAQYQNSGNQNYYNSKNSPATKKAQPSTGYKTNNSNQSPSKTQQAPVMKKTNSDDGADSSTDLYLERNYK